MFDAILIKNNHVDCVNGDIVKAAELCRKNAKSGTKLEIEVRDLDELEKALNCSPDVILLDNMTPAQISDAILFSKSNFSNLEVSFEASGGITKENLRAYAESGVDYISVGALTHSVKASDISLRFQEHL